MTYPNCFGLIKLAVVQSCLHKNPKIAEPAAAASPQTMAADNRSLIELPKVNLEDILMRLPLPSLLVCCCVSKSLLSLIKNEPDFARMHFAKSESQLMIHTPVYSCFHFIDLDADINSRVEINQSFSLPLRGFEVTCSCNGLLLLENVDLVNDSHQCMVFNPVTGEYILLPENATPYRNLVCAFFYCLKTNQFKVLRAFYSLDPESDASSDSYMELDPSLDSDSATKLDLVSARERGSVSSLHPGTNSDTMYSESHPMGEIFVGGSDSWESLGNLPFSHSTFYSPCYLNKATYWLSDSVNGTPFIVFFDFETHQFGGILAPAQITQLAHDYLTLVVLGGRLSIFDNFDDTKIDVWVMKEQGVPESWTREYVIDTTVWGEIVQYNSFHPIVCRNNGEVVMVSRNSYMIFYDLVKKKGRIVNHPPLQLPWNAVVHTPGLMSLRYVVRGNLELLNVASRISYLDFSRINYLEVAGTFSE